MTVQTSDSGAGLKFINLIIHDTAGGFGLWVEAIDAEVYGCLAYYKDWTAPDRGSGHGFYVQNLTGNSHIADNIIFSNFSHGIQVYGSALAALNNVTIQGNTFFDSGLPSDYQRNVLVGRGSIAQNPKIIDNVLYYPASTGQNLNVGYDPYGAGAANPVITGNYVLNGENATFGPLNTGVTMTGNFFYTPVDASSPPTPTPLPGPRPPRSSFGSISTYSDAPTSPSSIGATPLTSPSTSPASFQWAQATKSATRRTILEGLSRPVPSAGRRSGCQ